MIGGLTVTAPAPCGCSYTWAHEIATGRVVDIVIPCAEHAALEPTP